MTRYILKKDYPNHKIGDIIQKTDSPWPIWEWEDGTPLAIDFEPHKATDWWQKIEEEKSLEQYEAEMLSNLEKEFKGYFYTAKRGCPRIYWTEVLRVIAEDLNKNKNWDERKWVIDKSDGSTSWWESELQGAIYFKTNKDCQKAIDMLGENIKYLFND